MKITVDLTDKCSEHLVITMVEVYQVVAYIPPHSGVISSTGVTNGRVSVFLTLPYFHLHQCE